MGVEIVWDDVEFAIRECVNRAVHEPVELDAAAALGAPPKILPVLPLSPR
jgi:hypothetical protein